VTIEQVEEDKLLGITLDGQLSCSSLIEKVVGEMGRAISVKKHHEYACQSILVVLMRD
jgi:hypothetical protein